MRNVIFFRGRNTANIQEEFAVLLWVRNLNDETVLKLRRAVEVPA